jgi:hypothetical protein
VSIRALAEKYSLNPTTVYRHSKADGWQESRKEAANETRRKSIQKTADAAASNAAKLEKAKGLALDLALEILSNYPKNAGNKLRTFGKDKYGNDIMTEFELLSMVTVLEKLGKGGVTDAEDDPLMKLLEALNNAARQ